MSWLLRRDGRPLSSRWNALFFLVLNLYYFSNDFWWSISARVCIEVNCHVSNLDINIIVQISVIFKGLVINQHPRLCQWIGHLASIGFSFTRPPSFKTNKTELKSSCIISDSCRISTEIILRSIVNWHGHVYSPSLATISYIFGRVNVNNIHIQ